MPRADLFIDASNFSIACRNYLGSYVDVKAFARRVAKEAHHGLGDVFYYDSPPPPKGDQRGKQRFWEGLKESHVTLRLGRLDSNYDGTHREKECDVMLAVDMVVRAYEKRYDRAILVSADTDMACAVEAVQKLGLEVGWTYFPTQQHIDRLRQLIPTGMRIELTEKFLRTLRQQSYSRQR